MAASTTMPTAKAIPANETTFSDRPSAAMATKDAITDTGMANAMTSVARLERRKVNRMMTASVPPTQMFWTTKSIDELIYIVSS